MTKQHISQTSSRGIFPLSLAGLGFIPPGFEISVSDFCIHPNEQLVQLISIGLDSPSHLLPLNECYHLPSIGEVEEMQNTSKKKGKLNQRTFLIWLHLIPMTN